MSEREPDWADKAAFEAMERLDLLGNLGEWDLSAIIRKHAPPQPDVASLVEAHERVKTLEADIRKLRNDIAEMPIGLTVEDAEMVTRAISSHCEMAASLMSRKLEEARNAAH